MSDTTTIEPLTVSIAETKRLTGLGETTIYELIEEGRLKITKVKTRTLVDYQSVKALVTPPSAVA